MANLRPIPITPDPTSGWQNIVQRVVQSQNVMAGSGMRRTMSTGDFSQFGVKIEPDIEHLVWRGDYTGSSEYQVNDVVRVLPDIKYYNDYGTELTIGSTDQPIDQNEGDVIPISLGLFVCVKYVPPNWADPTYFSEIQNQFNAGEVPYDVGNSIRWSQHNVYYPIFPEIPSQYTSSINTGLGFELVANDVYWRALPFGVLPTKLCQNGVERDFYVIGMMSGSKFDPSNLPYQT